MGSCHFVQVECVVLFSWAVAWQGRCTLPAVLGRTEPWAVSCDSMCPSYAVLCCCTHEAVLVMCQQPVVWEALSSSRACSTLSVAAANQCTTTVSRPNSCCWELSCTDCLHSSRVVCSYAIVDTSCLLLQVDGADCVVSNCQCVATWCSAQRAAQHGRHYTL